MNPMEFSLDQAIPMLRSTPRVLRSWLADLPGPWITSNEGEGTWSPYDIVGHLIHGERTDWIPRLELILNYGQSQAFIPFDRFAQFAESRGKTLGQLLDIFAELRELNLGRLAQAELSSQDLARGGLHPELGPVTLGQLLATWLVHDLNHLAQIARVMSRRYRSTVGPWIEYLPILTR
jgi:hypothetical protein